MKTFLARLVLVVACAVVLAGTGIAAAEAGAPPAAEKPCPGCPQAAAGKAAGPPAADRMKAHLEGMKGALAALRDSEKALAAAEDPKAFRAAVIEHLKKLDDLQASHLAHMESMMQRAPGGMPGMHRDKDAGCGCGECRCRDCQHGDCRDKDCRHRHGCRECCEEDGHAH